MSSHTETEPPQLAGSTTSPPPPEPSKRAQQRADKRAKKQATKSAALPFKVRWAKDRQMVLMMLPGVLFLLIFFYIPILGNVIAFQDYQPFLGIGGSEFVGFLNFANLYDNPDFWNAFWNTLKLAGVQLLLFFPIPLALAIIVDSLISNKVRRIFQSIAYLPHFLSWVLVITLFQQMLGGAGFVNNTLQDMGTGAIPFMTNPDTFPLLVVAQLIWKDAGWAMIIFLAALANVDVNLYEAAAADGAGRWRRLWHITLPALRTVIILLLILRIGDILSVGFEQLILQRDNVGAGAAEVLDTFTYYAGVLGGDWSAGAAAGLAKGIIGALLIWGANSLAHRFGEAGIFQKRER